MFVSTLAVNLLAIFAVFELFTYFLPIPQSRSMALLENYIFWWVLLVVDTALIGRSDLAGLYFLTFCHSGALVALLLDLVGHFTLPSARGKGNRDATNVVDDGEEDDRPGLEESNERTPLLANDGHAIRKSEISEDYGLGLWIFEFLFSVPIPVILLTQMTVMLLNALNQTLADGSPASTVYLSVSVLSTLIFVPFLPFVHKLHRAVPYIAIVVAIITILYNALAFPFSVNSPLKVFFQQTMDLDAGNNSIQLTGVDPWLSNRIVPEIPSSWGTDHRCSHRDSLRAGLPSCLWSGLTPHITADDPSTWLSVNATQTAPGMGLISISGTQTRACRLYFDAPVSAASVRNATGEIQKEFPVDVDGDGITEVRLWSRSWGKVFEVSVAWDVQSGDEKGLRGRAACEWAEEGVIPAMEEVVSFLPKWARVNNG